MPLCICYRESYEGRQKTEHQRFLMLINFIASMLAFHFLFMSSKSSGLKLVSYLLLGNDLSTANVKTWPIYEVMCDEFELQGMELQCWY